jgi:hypothetical protein
MTPVVNRLLERKTLNSENKAKRVVSIFIGAAARIYIATKSDEHTHADHFQIKYRFSAVSV